MRVTIPPDLRAYLGEKVEAGRYQTAGDAITEGLRLLKERDEAEFQALQRLLRDRLKESKVGTAVPFDAKVREQIRQRGMQRLNASKRRRS
jgi:antitoxin ParD1/3/4